MKIKKIIISLGIITASVAAFNSTYSIHVMAAVSNNTAIDSDIQNDATTSNSSVTTDQNNNDNATTISVQNNNNNNNNNTAATNNPSNNDLSNIKTGIKIKIRNSVTATEVLKGKFVKKKGRKYFKKKKGGYAKNMFFTYGKNVYRVNKKGAVITGWFKYKNNYYFFDRNSGKMKIGGKADNFKISRYGVFKDNKYNLSRVKVYLLAQEIVEKYTKPTDSKSEKLYKCYRWLAKYPYMEFRKVRDTKKKHPKDWDVIYARDIFDRHKGCCASDAAAFAYLAKTCGYKDVKICSDTGHCWVDIDGKLYDTLFAEDRGFSKNYNATYWDYRVHPSYYKKL